MIILYIAIDCSFGLDVWNLSRKKEKPFLKTKKIYYNNMQFRITR